MESRRLSGVLIQLVVATTMLTPWAVCFQTGGLTRRFHLPLQGGLLTLGRGMMMAPPPLTAASTTLGPTSSFFNNRVLATRLQGRGEASFNPASDQKPWWWRHGQPQLHAVSGGDQPASKTTSPKKRSGFAWKTALLGVALAAAQVSIAVASSGSAASAPAKLHLGQKIANALRQQTGWPDWVILMTVSALPIVELRGGVPVGIWMGIPPLTTMALACIGNFIPVPFIMVALNKLEWLMNKVQPVVEKKLKDVTGQRLNWQYLAVFVGVPLPGTGAWTGAAIAALFKMSYTDSLLGIVLGILSAAAIMTTITMAGTVGGVIVGVALFLSILSAFKEDKQ